MKKFIYIFLFSIFLIGCATTNVESNVSDNNKKAHKELRKEFENYSQLPVLKVRGFDLKKLDTINDWEEMRDYLQPFFIDENGMPVDNHASFELPSNVQTQSTMKIDFSDEYGSKDELLNKGYKEDEIFYYPYFNGEWKDGYRVGKKYMDVGNVKNLTFNKNYFDVSKNALLVGLRDFVIENNIDDNKECYDLISISKKDYLILDLSYNGGGNAISWLSLIEAIKKMKPKEIFILCSDKTCSMGEWATSWIEVATKIKTTVIGCPTWGGWKCVKTSKVIFFDGFSLECSLNDKESNWKWGWDLYKLPYPTEGIGATPDIYTDGNAINSLEVVKHLIGDSRLSLPKDYYKECLKFYN